jgi:amidohydrolase
MSDLASELVTLRRSLHRIPELSWREHETGHLLKGQIGRLGVVKPIAKTGFYVDLGSPRAERTLLLRADMDALPIQEATGLSYASTKAGCMHACGHDGHMAVLLGVARWLAAGERIFPGPIKLIFQPAEETGLGAPALIREGVLQDPEVSAIFALHGWPELPVGALAIPDRAIMAAVDNFEITLKGTGGHGAMPHLARDPVVAAALLITAAQTLVSRRTSPLEAAVLTFGHVSAGKANNVIPEACLLRGTLRTFEPALRKTLRAGFETLVARTAEAHGIASEITWVEACPATRNDPAMAALAREGVSAALGKDCLRSLPPSMGGEDFAYFLEKVPGAYFWLGLGMDRGGLHNPRFDFNDEAIATGIAAFAGIVERFFGDDSGK